MEVIAKIFVFILAMAAVILILAGAAADGIWKKVFFIGGLVLFVLAGFLKFLTMIYYNK